MPRTYFCFEDEFASCIDQEFQSIILGANNVRIWAKGVVGGNKITYLVECLKTQNIEEFAQLEQAAKYADKIKS